MNQERPSILGKQVKIILGIGVLLGMVWFIVAIRGIMAPFALAFILAYVLGPLVDHMEGRGINRTGSILLVFLLVFTVLGLGVFKAGGKVTDEIIELSDEFLRKEMVEEELILTNKGDQPLVCELRWEDEGVDRPFSIVDSDELPIEIDPGLKEVVKLRFAPKNKAEAQNTLYLSSGVWPASVKIRVKGNASREGDRASTDVFWKTGEFKNEVQIYDLVLSATGIDFGRAGPNIISSISQKARDIQPMVQPYLGEDVDLAEFVTKQGRSLIDEKLLGGTTEVLGGVFSGITFVVIVPFVAFFFLKEGHRITRNLIELVPNAYFELCLNLLHQINGQIGGYIRGQILATSVVATLAVSGLFLIDMPYALPLGLLAGLANMIPFLGPLIGIISASIVALATGGGVAVVGKVVIVFLIIQMVDNVLIQPTVVAKSVEMHPLVVLFVVMVGSQLMGIVGMLIAVPVTGIIKVSTQTIYQGVKRYRTQ